MSAGPVGLVPLGVVTVTSTVPELPAGAVAVICVGRFTVNVVAGVAPNFTAVAPVKFAPVIVTTVPPAIGPFAGDTAVTVGPAVALTTRVCVASGLTPLLAVTVQLTVPGAVAVPEIVAVAPLV